MSAGSSGRYISGDVRSSKDVLLRVRDREGRGSSRRSGEGVVSLNTLSEADVSIHTKEYGHWMSTKDYVKLEIERYIFYWSK